jgi:hypothetical protein
MMEDEIAEPPTSDVSASRAHPSREKPLGGRWFHLV